MPTYVFQCDAEDGGCDYVFERQMSMDKISSYRPRCPECKKSKPIHQVFNHDVYAYAGCRTVGVVADRNTSHMSEDEKHHLNKKHTEYRRQPYTGPLPEGVQVKERSRPYHD